MIKTCNNGGLIVILDWNLFIYQFMVFFYYIYLIFKVFIIIHEYANGMIYISDHRKHVPVSKL